MRPPESPPAPTALAWDLWVGLAAWRAYHLGYPPGQWRGWAPFGTGILGDWTCRVLDPSDCGAYSSNVLARVRPLQPLRRLTESEYLETG